MSTVSQSAALVSQLPVPCAVPVLPGYYRSKLFVVSSTTNPLVAAAGPLLSLLERLCVSPTLPAIASIRDNIEHELQAFQSKLIGPEYAKELVAIANYLLCATIDELLGKSYLRLNGELAEFNAFTPVSFDEKGPQTRFFDILRHMKQHPTQYLDVLELTYYCLIAGFEGEQHLQPHGRQTLDNLIEELYQLIQLNRVNKPHRLFAQPRNIMPQPVSHKRIIILGLFTLAAILSLYLTSHALIETKAKHLLFEHTLLAKAE